MESHVSQATAGAPVIDANGDHLGVVDAVEDSRVYVEPNEDISWLATTVLGWEGDDESYPLADRHVESVTDDAVYLKSNL